MVLAPENKVPGGWRAPRARGSRCCHSLAPGSSRSPWRRETRRKHLRRRPVAPAPRNYSPATRPPSTEKAKPTRTHSCPRGQSAASRRHTHAAPGLPGSRGWWPAAGLGHRQKMKPGASCHHITGPRDTRPHQVVWSQRQRLPAATGGHGPSPHLVTAVQRNASRTGLKPIHSEQKSNVITVARCQGSNFESRQTERKKQ